MTGTKSKRSGFSIVEGLLVVLAIGVLGFSSWLVYQRIKTSATTTGAAPNTNQQTTTQPAPTVTYLDIKEWGIKFPLPDSIKDAYYVPSNQNRAADGTPLTMWVGLKSLDAAGCDANSGNVAGGRSMAIGTIIRVSPTDQDPVTGQLYVNEYPNTIIGNYAYVFSDTAKSRTCAPAATLQSIGSSFSTAIKSATTDTTTTN